MNFISDMVDYMSEKENACSDSDERDIICESCSSSIETTKTGTVGSKVIDSMFSDVQVYEVSDSVGIQIACSYCVVKESYRGLLGGDTIDRIVFDFDNGTATVYKLPEHGGTEFEPVMVFDLLIALVPKSEEG